MPIDRRNALKKLAVGGVTAASASAVISSPVFGDDTPMPPAEPIVVPIVVQMGVSPIWFGVVFVNLIETALITPPIGMNLFVVQSVRKSGPFRDVVIGSLPFVVLMFLMIVALIASAALDLQSRGVLVLGPVPSGLPPLGIPTASPGELLALIPGALGLALLSFADTAATGRSFAARANSVHLTEFSSRVCRRFTSRKSVLCPGARRGTPPGISMSRQQDLPPSTTKAMLATDTTACCHQDDDKLGNADNSSMHLLPLWDWRRALPSASASRR